MDVVDAPRALHVIWTIRLVVCIAALGAYAFTFSRHFEYHMQLTLSSLLLLGGVGLVGMLAVEGTGQQYFDGPALVILAAYVAIRLRFIYATVVGWLTTVAYVAVAVGYRGEAAEFVASSIWFVIAANLIGMFATYELESLSRRDFLQVRALDAKRGELEVARAQAATHAARLTEIDAAKDRFFANISHELRTPLTLLLGPLRAAMNHPEEAQEALVRQHPMMKRSAERLLALVNELLDLARLDAGRLRLRVAEHDFVALTRTIVSAFTSRAGDEGIRLHFDATRERLDGWVDAERYEQVVSNLITNALKFTPVDGHVHVTLRADGRRATLAVRDTGEGIPVEALPHIFQRFRQADDATTRRYGGVGIGLALVRELVTLHGGTVSAESEVGVGSVFTVCLPLDREHVQGATFADERATAPPASQAPGPPALSTLSAGSAIGEQNKEGTTERQPLSSSQAMILVVEDHADMRNYLRDLLSPHYDVEEAADGEGGLAIARSLAADGRTPDLILSDIMMPGIDGYTLCHALKEDEALGHVPVVLLTARADEESKLEGLGKGADDYLAKPFSPEELLARCENLIEVRRRLRARFSDEVVVRPTDVYVSAAECDWLEEVITVCEARLQDASFGVDWLADEFDVSTRTLQRRLKAASGLTPGAFLRTMRLERAAQLLDGGMESIGDVAALVGYVDADSFSRAFRQGFGVSPSTYARREDTDRGDEPSKQPV